jgi:hypothetical protein
MAENGELLMDCYCDGRYEAALADTVQHGRSSQGLRQWLVIPASRSWFVQCAGQTRSAGESSLFDGELDARAAAQFERPSCEVFLISQRFKR